VNASLTAIDGLRVGHWSDPVARTGVTVILCPDEGCVASASFAGPSPGTREAALLAPEKRVERVHALVFTGGSAFGRRIRPRSDRLPPFMQSPGVQSPKRRKVAKNGSARERRPRCFRPPKRGGRRFR